VRVAGNGNDAPAPVRPHGLKEIVFLEAADEESVGLSRQSQQQAD
jgi:hypothetical protein